MVYKVLEGFDIGCESHFFVRDLSNFYIATRDAGADGPFLTYESLKKQQGPLKQIWDNLSSKNVSPEFLSQQYPQDFIEGILSLDLVSRILRLTDFQTNPGNFGFVFNKEKKRYEVKGIDFRIDTLQDFKTQEGYFNGLLIGNGSVSYSDFAMNYIFKKWPQQDRMLATKDMFSRIFSCYPEIIDQAFSSAVEGINFTSQQYQQETLHSNELLIQDLEEYAEAIKFNFTFFEEKLNKYKPINN